MLIVRAAIKNDVSLRLRISGRRVVGDFIGVQDIGAVINLSVSVEQVERALLFLLEGGDSDVLLVEGWVVCWARPELRRQGKATGW